MRVIDDFIPVLEKLIREVQKGRDICVSIYISPQGINVSVYPYSEEEGT